MTRKILFAMFVALAVTGASTVNVVERFEPPFTDSIALPPAPQPEPRATTPRRVGAPEVLAAGAIASSPRPTRSSVTQTRTIEASTTTFLATATVAPAAATATAGAGTRVAIEPAPPAAPAAVEPAPGVTMAAASSPTSEPKARSARRGRGHRPSAGVTRVPTPVWAQGVGTNPAQPAQSRRQPGPKHDSPAAGPPSHGRGRTG